MVAQLKMSLYVEDGSTVPWLSPSCLPLVQRSESFVVTGGDGETVCLPTSLLGALSPLVRDLHESVDPTGHLLLPSAKKKELVVIRQILTSGCSHKGVDEELVWDVVSVLALLQINIKIVRVRLGNEVEEEVSSSSIVKIEERGYEDDVSEESSVKGAAEELQEPEYVEKISLESESSNFDKQDEDTFHSCYQNPSFPDFVSEADMDLRNSTDNKQNMFNNSNEDAETDQPQEPEPEDAATTFNETTSASKDIFEGTSPESSAPPRSRNTSNISFHSCCQDFVTEDMDMRKSIINEQNMFNNSNEDAETDQHQESEPEDRGTTINETTSASKDILKGTSPVSSAPPSMNTSNISFHDCYQDPSFPDLVSENIDLRNSTINEQNIFNDSNKDTNIDKPQDSEPNNNTGKNHRKLVVNYEEGNVEEKEVEEVNVGINPEDVKLEVYVNFAENTAEKVGETTEAKAEYVKHEGKRTRFKVGAKTKKVKVGAKDNEVKGRRKTVDNNDPSSVRVYDCDHCQMTFKQGYSFARHNERVHGALVATYKCELCQKTYYRKQDINSHELRKYHKKMLAKFEVKVELPNIGLTDNTSKKVPKVNLQRVCQPPTPISGYGKRKFVDGKWVCHICHLQFDSYYKLNPHLDEVHQMKVSKYYCDVCKFKCYRKQYYKNHIQSRKHLRLSEGQSEGKFQDGGKEGD